MLQYVYLSRLRLALTRMQIFKWNRICFLFRYLSNHWSMFTKLLEKWERKNLQRDTCSSSLFMTRWRVAKHQYHGLMTGFRVCLKDLNIIERRLLNMILNGSLLKRFRFLDEFSSLTLRFTITWSFIDVIWCAPQSNKSLRTMRNEIVYIPVRKHWSGRR